MRIFIIIFLIAGLAGLAGCTDQSGTGNPDPRPNILLIIADDLGYSDLGVFGGEISTPNLDALAGAGKMLTNFHVAPTCSPTRAMLMSGADAHRAGLGTMNGLWSEEQKGKPGYEGFLNKDIVTFVRLLKEAGYHTYMSGKWQLGYEDGYYPLDRGFEEAFWLKFGGASHFSDMRGITKYGEVAYWGEGREQLQSLPGDFYSSVYFTDKMIDYIDKNRADGKPFFAYAAYTAPHWPLQAPREYIDKYEGVYDGGYDAIRTKRIERMLAAGLMEEGQTPAAQHPEWPGWDKLDGEQKKLEVRMMQIYAAMVDALDENIGRLVQYLKDTGEYENTFILFFSDNGAEGNNPHDLATNPTWVPQNFDLSYENMGQPGSYASTGPGWAHVSNTPYHMYKGFPAQGGLLSPTIAVFPERIEAGSRSDAFITVLDVAPTLLQLANVTHPAPEFDGRRVHSMVGESFYPHLIGRQPVVHGPEHVFGLELFNRRMIRQGDWKLLWNNRPWGKGDWELYNLEEDSGEQNDLAQARPGKLQDMLALWQQYVDDNDVLVFDELKMRFTNGKDHYEYQ
ncbi:MAG: arylsulfatase [Gammaproteobacteria bacterium]|nr:arylsulfatase [Gammaproteobacteria bacterium]